MAVNPSSCVFVYSMSLLSHLTEFRQSKALTEKIPLYCVFGDTVMRSISQSRPTSVQQLQQIRGFSSEKCSKYGDEIIRLVQEQSTQGSNDGNDEGSAGRNKKALPAVVMRFGRGGKSSLLRKRHHGSYSRPFNPSSKISPGIPIPPGIPAGKEGVYILELAQGRVYVGHSSDMRRRLHQHISGQGSAFTKAFPPTGVMLPRLGCVTGSAEAAERDETLRYMFLRGIQLVRGWRYTKVHMPDSEVEDAEQNIRELFDLCRRCGHPGHFITNCKANFDRLGRACKPCS